MTRTSWTEKHRPAEWTEIQGNGKALEAIQRWIEDWELGDPPQLFVGPPGTGKTSTAYVAATASDRPLNEIDASTARTKADIARVCSEMEAGEQLVLLDECDSWPTQANVGPLAEALKSPGNPIVMTANAEHDVPDSLKSTAEVREFSLSEPSRKAKLKEVAAAEGVPLDETDLDRLAARPDLRSAINDLQIHASMGVPVAEDQRSWESSEFAAMDRIIQHGDTRDVDIRPPWLIMWLDQNVRKEFKGLELATAYDALARADVHLGHAGQGDYRGWRYAGVLAEQVAELRLSEAYTGWIRWDFPEWVRSSMPRAEEDTPEAALFRELKAYGEPWYQMSGSYVDFREWVLPILRRLPRSERIELIKEASLGEEAASALDVTSRQHAEATVQTSPAPGPELGPATGDAMEGDW